MRAPSEERGFVLVMVLLFLAMGSMVIVPTLSLTYTAVKSRGIYTQDIKHDYAADAAIKYGMWLMSYEPDFIASIPAGEESTPFSVTINGVTATAAIKPAVAAGELSTVGLAGDHQILPTKTVDCIITATQQQVDCDSAPAAIPMTFTYTISMQRVEPDDLTFDPLDKVKDSLDLGFSYVLDSSKLDGLPFNDDDLTVLFQPVRLKDEPSRFELDGGADAMVEQASPDTNYGTGLEMHVQSDASSNVRSFVRFDGLGIVPGSTIIKAELKLCANSPTAGESRTYQVHRVTASWDETAVTWNNQPAVAGGATAGTAAPENPDDCIKWNVSTDVQAWVDGTAPNYGWRISDAAEGSPTPYTTIFRTQENPGNPVDPPVLKIWSSTSSYQTIEWDFNPNLDFPNHGDTRTLSFQANATLEADTRYCNVAQLLPHHTHTGLTAPVTTGTPAPAGCPRGGVAVSKTADPAVVFPGEPTIVTYVISVTNNDIGRFSRFDSIEDYLPPGFAYVSGSASAAWPGRNSPDNPSYPYNVCDFEPNVTSEPDGRLRLKWHKEESANGSEPGFLRCHDYPLPEGATYTLTFQALANLTDSGSYYNEVIARVKDLGRFGGDRGIEKFDRLYSWPTAEIVVPRFDIKAQTNLTTLYTNTVVSATGISVISWHWETHR